MISIAGFGLLLLFACLLGYETIGTRSILLLILLRYIGGVFMGGEYTPTRRARAGNGAASLGGIQGAYPIGFFFVSVITTIMLSATSPDEYPAVGLAHPVLDGLTAVGFALAQHDSDPDHDARILVRFAGGDQRHAGNDHPVSAYPQPER